MPVTLSQIRAAALAKKQDEIVQPADVPGALAAALSAEVVEMYSVPDDDAEEKVYATVEEEEDEDEIYEPVQVAPHGSIEYHLGALNKMREDIRLNLEEAEAAAVAAKAAFIAADKRAEELREILRKLSPTAPAPAVKRAPGVKRAKAETDLDANNAFRAEALAAGYIVKKSSTVNQRGGDPLTAHKNVLPHEVGTPVETHKNDYKMYLKMMQAKRDIAKSGGKRTLASYTKDWKLIK